MFWRAYWVTPTSQFCASTCRLLRSPDKGRIGGLGCSIERLGFGHTHLSRIGAASLNYRDLAVIGGERKLALPLVPLSDAAGTVIATGRGVSRFAVGDRAMPIFAQGWIAGPQPPDDVLPTLGGPLDGVLVEHGAWPESGLVRVPDGLGDVEAATLPCAAVSAWNALFVAAAA
jgi:NADPH:quinone reductase-like Zn-dependent oxidoreductase